MAFALVLIFLLSSPAYAGYQNLAIAAGQSDFYYDAPKNQTFARFAANDPIYNAGTQTVNTTRPYNVVGIDGKTYQTTITRTAAADIPKVGAALSKFAQRVGPLSMGIATVELICSLSNICKDAAGAFTTSEMQTLPAGDSAGWTCSHATSQAGTIDWCKANYYGCNSPNRLCSEDAVIDGGLGYFFG